MTTIVLNTVSGTIYDAFNAPVPNLSIQAFDKDLRTEQLLGQAVTDANGQYTISYDASKFADSEYKTADIFIRIVEAGIFLQSPTYFNVPANFVLDFKIDNSPIKELNEFDALVQIIQALTEPQKVALADIRSNDPDDITFLANETGEDATRIALLPIAFTLSNQTKLATDIFYGLFRLKFPTDLRALLLIKSESIVNGIQGAISQNIISAKWGIQKELDAILQIFNQLASGAVLSGSDDQSAAFKQVIGAALPKPEMQQTFVSVFLANEKTPEKFWDTLSTQTGFTDPKVITNIQSALQLNLLTNNVPSLTTLLFSEQQQNPSLTDLRGFATYTFDDWHTRIDKLVATGALVNFPDSITGATPEEKTVNYANSLTSLVKTLYPTSVFASQLSKDDSSAFKDTKTDLTTFLANNVDFDLNTNSINSLFDSSNQTGVTDKVGLKSELTTINRLSKITSDYNHVSALKADGIDSATALVNKYTTSQFVEKFAPSMTADTATAVYKTAQKTDNLSTVLAMGIKMRNDIPIYAINGPTNDASPDYESMFGDTNCDCADCQSVYSPSAYFVDILNLTRQNNQDALDKITNRRPDLVHILLTCKNTNTPLPYIDLVNELFENVISPLPPVIVNGSPTFPQYQTTNSPEELLAYPEHVDTAAYDILKTATSAFNLPLDLPLEETRLYMDKLGVKRHGLMELFFGKNTNSIYNDLSIAADYLQLSQPDELNLVNGTTQMPVTLGKVSDFLVATGLTYIEMLQLLECYFINPLAGGERTIKIVSTPDPTSCKIEDMTLQTSDTTSLKINPFIRLWKKTGWDLLDLDRAFFALGISDYTGDVNANLIIPLSHIARLKVMFNLSVQDIVTLWSKIDTHVYVDHSIEGQPAIPTQYQSLFQNKQVTNPVDPDLSNPDALAGTLAAKSGIIVAALNLSQKDFITLNNTPFVDGNLTLSNLSVLFRYTLLSKVLKLSIGDLINTIGLTSINPFGNSLNTSDTLKFIDTIGFISSSGFSLPVLISLLSNDPSVLQAINFNDVSQVLITLREGLQKIELLEPSGATPQEQAKNKLQNQNSFISDTIGTAFKTESKVIDVLINNLVKSVADNSKPAITPIIDAVFIASVGPLFTVDTSNVITWVFPDLFNTYVLLSNTWDRISKLISKLKISSDEFIYFQANEIKLNIEGLWNLPVSDSASVLFSAYASLSYIIRFRNALAATTSDWYTIFDIAIFNATDAKKNFINSLINLSSFNINTYEFLLGPAANVNDTGFLKFSFPADYLNGAVLLNIINCASTAGQLGSSVDNISKLTIPALDSTASALASSLLKSRYDIPTWLSILTPLSNQLRVIKRDALVSYILTSPETVIAKFRTDNNLSYTNSLFAYFLIDPEMDSCMLTSRIKQAISSMQLFVDRCLMNLEGITLSTDFTTQWDTWRKRYRIWEANRKIFLYPENWIEPELRDDKSPFFKELESKLRQNDISNDIAEQALSEYLEKLDAISNLEIIGVYQDSLNNIVHTIGRTKNVPQLYYYTSQEQSVWSAWEKIDLDIEGDHILAVVWNNRLMLFWALFTEKQEEASNGFNVPPANGYIPPSPKYLEVKLAWSEYKNGKWSPKTLSKEVLRIDEIQVRDHRTIPETIYYEGGDPSLYSLSSFINDDQLFVRVFMPVIYNNRQYQNNRFGAFYFDGCHSSPTVRTADSNVEGLKISYVFTPIGSIDNSMFIDEMSNDALTIFDTGIFKVSSGTINSGKVTLFNNTPGIFRILSNRHEIENMQNSTFYYNNERSVFYVHSTGGFIRPPSWVNIGVLTQGVLISRNTVEPTPFVNSVSETNAAVTRVIPSPATGNIITSGIKTVDQSSFSSVFFGRHYSFQTFYHPYVCELIKTLNTSGIDGLYKTIFHDTDGTKDGIQNKNSTDIFIKNGPYDPTNAVSTPYPVEQVDFSYSAMYSIYNWEIFFHIPLLIATRLSQNQMFEEARKWFHYIFDPTRSLSSSVTGAERFWITKPFKEEIRNGILPIEDLLNNASPDLDLQLKTMAKDPFNPHAIARLRISAYMRTTIMKYIDNLISWGDQLFQQNTLETINEATLLYVLAANMLGKKPDEIPPRAVPEENSFSSLQNIDSFSNAKVKIQSFFSLSDLSDNTTNNLLQMPLFCIPKNDILLGYWDTVSDRLFKIRHCQNIEGVFQQLPLFEPPINPALLVKAAASGLDLASILSNMNSSLPIYRFQGMLQKANEICSDVKGLGNELLSVLEKKDIEQLSLLRSSHELNMLAAIRDIKSLQVDEANETLNSLNKSKELIQAKKDYYSSRVKKNSQENEQLALLNNASDNQKIAILGEILASVLGGIPVTTAGLWSFGVSFGGPQLASVSKFAAYSLGMLANQQTTGANIAGTEGSYQRRQDDWTFQSNSADLELKQIDKQIMAAEIRVEIAGKELDNHDLQIQQSQEVDEFLNSKYTNEDLYSYMVEQISSVYFQSYQLAFNIAKKAEKCYQYELGIENSSFISFGYWDSLKKGLLSGEKLQFDLRRLENAYLDQNIREYELIKHISMVMLNPLALIKLRSTGTCDFDIPEVLYDMDYAGHYFRRIKSASISLPCIAGPYTSVSATLSLITSKYRKNTDTSTGYNESAGNDPRFNSNAGTLQSIATSNAQNDSGIFELNFRDERYLPFEGAGAVSSWHLELPTKIAQFDYNTISDVIIHVKYTSREGGSELKDAANISLGGQLNAIKQQLLGETGLHVALDLKHDLSNEWNLLKNNGIVDLIIDKSRLPYMVQTLDAVIENVMFIAKVKNNPSTFPISVNGTALSLSVNNGLNLYTGTSTNIAIDTPFRLSVTLSDLTNLEELVMVVKYSVASV